jgi:phosphopantetheine--protein transferase-like protein
MRMKKVLGCGIDIEEIVRFENKIPTRNHITDFAKFVYTPSEIASNLTIHPEFSFPIGFSCKEAFFKALGISWTNSKILWTDIELLFENINNLKEYSIRLNGYAKELFNEKKCYVIESDLEYTKDYIIFQVILFS